MKIYAIQKWFSIFLVIPVLISGWGGLFPITVQAAGPNLHEIVVGTVNSNKEIVPKGEITEIDISSISATLGATIADIEINGVKDNRQVLGFADLDDKADRGWYFVDIDEAIYWINRFGGNQSYILSGGDANVYSSTVTAINQAGFNPYQAYNLAELATASGGAGFTSGDNLVPDGNGYKSVGHFRTTQRPTGNVTAPKTEYEINDIVPITVTGNDFSYYHRGIIVWSVSVINTTTGRGYQQLSPHKVIKDPSTKEWPVNNTVTPEPFSWSETYNYVPTESGVYEVTFVMTDRNHRSRQGSPTMTESTPYVFRFTVGTPLPPPDEGEPVGPEDPPPGPACSPNSSRTTMNFQVVGDKDIKDYSRVESGGSAIPVEPYADISLFASKPGTFQMDGVELRPGSGNDRTRGLGYFGGSGTVTITYVSDDGRDCWEKSFRVQSGGNEENSCPKITVNHTSYRSGSTIEVMPGEELKFRASFTNKAGETDRASVWWIVTKPDGTEDTSGNYETDNRDRERWRAEPYWEFDLPRWARGKQSSRLDPHDIPLEPGKTYHLRIGYEGTTFANLDCNNWEVTVVVKDIACTIQEQNRIKMYRYGAYPNPIPPRGEEISGVAPHIIFTSMFTRLDDGRYDTNMGYYADVSGTWYLNENGTRTQLSDLLAPMERLHLYLPQHYGAGDTVLLELVTDTECVRTVTIEIHSDNKCPTKTLGNVRFNGGFSLVEETNWEYEVRFGETITIDPLDIRKGGTWRVSLQSDSPVRINSVAMRWYNPDTRNWERERNGKQMLPTKDGYKHYLYFPSDPDTDTALEGLYRITIYGENNTASSCEGDFFVEIGPTGDMENLLIVKSSFSITPKAPQFPGTEATVTFDIKNAGKTEHDTTLAVRWESSPTATMLDVKGFKPGEMRTITIPTLYPQKSEDFIGHINPDQDKPDNERIWTDNRAVWPVEVMKEIPSPPGGGGDFDGGEIGLEIYDSDNRQLQRLEVQADGVWEREPARIRVVIDQTKINDGFARTEQEINANIAAYKAQLEEYVSGSGVQNIRVTATPEQIVNAKSLAVYEPATLQLQMSGPGTPQQWPVSSASTGGDFLYTGTVVPTQTTWRQVLDSRPYVAQINGFVITMDYQIDFAVTYDVCSGDDEEETCDTRSFTRTMSGRYTITVTGGQRSFEVFEPNATGSIHHTAEWLEYHARDRYPDSRPNDFYAGERILSQLELQPRHRHPVSGKYPVVESAVAWISETGRQQTELQSRLVLQPAGEARWRGPNYQASKLGTREQGVDTPLMGDKQRGFQKDASYAVYYSVSFQFGVEKGFPYANKLSGTGHGQEDYRIPFRIIANAWERQGIRNHSTQ